MVNIDQHDHSGGPNKGVPIGTSGVADFSITYNKLNANVVDPTTGIGVNALLPNQLQILGLLKNIFQIATATGFIAKNGVLANARTFQDTATVVWTNPAGVAGNPSANLAATVTTSVAGTAHQIDASAVSLGVQTLSLSTNVINANQSCFRSNVTLPQTNVTGDGTQYKVLFGNVVFNQGSNFNSGTSVYTAPETGNYLISASTLLSDIVAAAGFVTILQIAINTVITDTIYYNPGPTITSIVDFELATGNQLMRLTAADTVEIYLTVFSSGGKTIDVTGGNFTALLLPA
jgi:hypothetical protein